MGSYGTNVYRGNPKGISGLSGVNFLHVNVIGKFLRGIVDANGNPVVTENIFTTADMERNLGGFNSTYFAPYVIRSLFEGVVDRLKGEIEAKCIGFVSGSAVQAAGAINDIAAVPLKLFDIKAARKGLVDKSAFGNKISYKITRSETTKMTLKSDMLTNGTAFTPDAIDNLKVGYFVRFNDGTNNVIRSITAIDTITGIVTLASGVGVGIIFTAALTKISRIDWNLFIAIDDNNSIPRQKESWENVPFAKSQTLGMPVSANDLVSGSDYVALTYATNASTDPDSIPAEVTTWTHLTAGSDGAAATDSDWLTLANTMKTYRCAFWLAPESTSTTHNLNMLGVTSSGLYGNYLVNIPVGATQDILQNYSNLFRSTVQFGEIPGDKRFNTINPTTGGKLNIPNIGHVASLWFNSFLERGEEYVAASNDYIIRTNDELVDNGIIAGDDAGNGKRLIVDYRINILEKVKGVGIVKKSGRTLSTDGGYMYENQVMQTLLYSEEIRAYRKKQEQQPGGADKQRQAQRAVDSFMRKKYDAGKFLIYQKEDKSYSTYEDVVSVVDDITTTPLADLAVGIDTLVFQFKAKPPIEFPNAEISSLSATFGII